MAASPLWVTTDDRDRRGDEAPDSRSYSSFAASVRHLEASAALLAPGIPENEDTVGAAWKGVSVGGVENVRGVFFQHAHSALTALDVVAEPHLEYLMVEGTEDVMDIAVFDIDRNLVLAKQVKTRAQTYTWGKGELLEILRRWLALDEAATASFQFVTDGRLGPSGEAVKTVLTVAASGDLGPAAALLDLPVTDAAVKAMARCTIHQDELGVEPVLAEAVREVRTLQAAPERDAEARAIAAVDRLIVQISKQAGLPNSHDRLLTTSQILELVDGSAAVEPRNRWGKALQTEYLNCVGSLAMQHLVKVSAIALGRSDEAPGSSAEITPLPELLEARFTTLSGRTGSGKSSASLLLRAAGQSVARAVIVVHAEAYSPDRLDSLVAEGLSAVIGRAVPTLTGRQALTDRTVTLIIDGVSEVPESVRDALTNELRASIAAGVGARIMLVGRDLAVLRSVFGTSTHPSRFELKDFDSQQRAALASAALTGTSLDASTEVAKAEHALGDMASNPMLLSMAVRLLAAGADFHDRASLYAGVIAEMAARTGATSISVTSAVLGIVYARLLNEERRYANEYEWQFRVGEACALLQSRGVTADPKLVQAAAAQSGLVTHIGHTQIRVPAHDSFADYLAGVAHSDNLQPLPTPLLAGDEQRVLFAGEHGGVTTRSATDVARDLPFLSLRHAREDHRKNTPASPKEVAALLNILAPNADNLGVRMWSNGERVIASLVPSQPSGWIEQAEGRELMARLPTAVIERPNGPLAIAVRLWTLHIQAQLNRTGPPRPATVVTGIRDVIPAIEKHTAETAAVLMGVLDEAFTPAEVVVLKARIGPLGMTGLVHASPAPFSGPHDYALHYISTETISVREATSEEAAALDTDWTRFPGTDTAVVSTRTESFLRSDPHTTALKKIRDAANKMAAIDWL